MDEYSCVQLGRVAGTITTSTDLQPSSLPCQPHPHTREHLVLEKRPNLSVGSSKIDDGEFRDASDKVIHRFGVIQKEFDIAGVGGISHLAEDVEGELKDVIRQIAVDLVFEWI